MGKPIRVQVPAWAPRHTAMLPRCGRSHPRAAFAFRNRLIAWTVGMDMRRTLIAAALTAIVTTGCAGSEWGPLAVVEATGDMARTEGTLRIVDGCLLLESDGEHLLLVWPADRTRWNAIDRAISFTTLAGEDVTIESGQAVVLTGGGSSVEEDGPGWAADIDWVQAPHDACLTDGAWFVNDAQ